MMALLILFLSLNFAQDTSEQGPYDLAFIEVTDSIYVAHRPDVTRLPVHGNATIIINRHDVVVVDAGASPSSARQIIEHIRSLTANPVSTVINTHGHEDHSLGNQAFLDAFPGAEIIARHETRDYLTSGRVQDRVHGFSDNLATRLATGEAEMSRLRERASPGDEEIIAYLRRYYEQDVIVVAREYEHVRITPPTTTFETRLVLARAGRIIELLNLGPGKSGTDAVVYLPAEKVVIAGDVVPHPLPYGFARDPAGWLDTLKRLADLEFDYLIPGHGDMLRDKKYLRQVIDLVGFTLTAVASAAEQGLDEEALRAHIDFSAWQERFSAGDPILAYRFDSWFIEPILVRAHQALSATPKQ